MEPSVLIFGALSIFGFGAAWGIWLAGRVTEEQPEPAPAIVTHTVFAPPVEIERVRLRYVPEHLAMG